MAPTFMGDIWPSLNSIMVGAPRTPSREGVVGLSSMFSLAMVTWPARSSEICSSAGAPMLAEGQGSEMVANLNPSAKRGRRQVVGQALSLPDFAEV